MELRDGLKSVELNRSNSTLAFLKTMIALLSWRTSTASETSTVLLNMLQPSRSSMKLSMLLWCGIQQQHSSYHPRISESVQLAWIIYRAKSSRCTIPYSSILWTTWNWFEKVVGASVGLRPLRFWSMLVGSGSRGWVEQAIWLTIACSCEGLLQQASVNKLCSKHAVLNSNL